MLITLLTKLSKTDTANNRALSMSVLGKKIVGVDLTNETKSVVFENSDVGSIVTII